MWRLRYRDSIHPEGVWSVEWFRTEAEAETYAFVNDTDPYEVRHVAWPPKGYYDIVEGGPGDELTNVVGFMNRWATHTLQ